MSRRKSRSQSRSPGRDRPAAARRRDKRFSRVTRVVCVVVLLIGAGFVIWLKNPFRRIESSAASSSGAAQHVAPVMPAPRESSLSRIVTVKGREHAEQLKRVLDPSHDGWDTERFSEVATSQLGRIADRIARPHASAAASLTEVLAAGFRCDPLCPSSPTEVARGERLRVLRWDHTQDEQPAQLEGVRGFADTLARLTSYLGTSEAARHVHLKIYRVQDRTAGMATHVRLEAAGRSDSARHQMTSTWLCSWKKADQAPPRLETIRLLDYEQVTFEQANQDWFSDRTSAVLAAAPSFRRELRFGMDHWVNRLDRRLMMSRFGHHGLAIADVNGDGWDDVYVCQPGGLPNRLFVQTSDGTARDMSSHAGVDYLDASTSAVFADLDNDGDQDLILATIPALAIFSNDGHGVFQPRAGIQKCDRAFSLSAVDYDQDGELDVFACRYRPDARHDFELPLPVPYQDANNGGRNLLLRNAGNWTFEDVTDDVGLGQNNSRFSFAAAWEDYDNDGDQDVYVANDFGRNCLYRNEQGHFTDVAAAADVEDIASGMSVTWGDYNQDGRMDVYISNMFSSAGNRISFQNSFAAGHQGDSRAQLQRHARGNTLFKNLTAEANSRFLDVSVPQGVTLGRWAWGSLFADVNNDSWDDLLVVNGLMTTEDPGDL